MKPIFGFFGWCLVDQQELEEAESKLAALEQEAEKFRQQKNALQHHLRQLDVLLNTIPDPVFFQDVDGTLQGCNLSFADHIVGLPREKILGRSLTEIGTRSQHRLPEDLFQPTGNAALPSGITPVEGKIRCADNRERDYIFSKAVIVESDGTITGSVGVMIDITERKKAEAEKEGLINELQEALATVKTLRGLLPVCSFCKKIRDDKGYWQQIEAYIQAHSEAVFSHSICKECAKIHYPELSLGAD